MIERSILIGGAYPAAIEAFQVQPAQFALEQPASCTVSEIVLRPTAQL